MGYVLFLSGLMVHLRDCVQLPVLESMNSHRTGQSSTLVKATASTAHQYVVGLVSIVINVKGGLPIISWDPPSLNPVTGGVPTFWFDSGEVSDTLNP